MSSQGLEEIIIETEPTFKTLLLDEKTDEQSVFERCTVTVTPRTAAFIVGFQILFFLALIVFVIVLGIKLLG